MDLTRVATVAVQSDPLSSHDLDGDMIGSMSPCQDTLMMGGCDGSCLADDSIEEVVVVADNSSNSLSGLGSLDSEGSSEATLAPSYFLAPCGDDGIPDRSAFEHEPTLILAPHDDHDSLQEEPISFSPIRFDESQQDGTSSSTVQTDINQNWFTTKEDKSSMQSKGHSWKQGMFSKEETEILEENIEKYCEERNISNPATVIFSMTKEERKDFYRTVAKGLNRPLFSVYRRVIRMYDNKNHIGKYSSEELDQLKALRAAHGNDWRVIGNALGRSAASIKDRCRLMKENCRQGVWLPAEERRLAEAVYDLSGSLPGEIVTSGLSWTQVAERVGSRSEKQCRTKWLNYLNWKEAGGTLWTREDDITLISTVYALGVPEENMIDWAEFAKDWSSVRSPQWLRGKWWSLKRNVPNASKMTFLEICDYLYKNYGQRLQLKEDVSKATTSNVTLISGDASLGARLQPKTSAVPLVSAVRLLNTTSSLTIQPTALSAGLVNSARAALQSVGSTPITLTATEGGGILEVIPQNFQLPTTSQTIVLASPGQGGIPIATTSLPQGQIIIRTIPTEPLQNSESLLVQMNLTPQVIANSDTQFLSSPKEPDCSAVSLDTSEIDGPNSYAMCCIDGEEFEVQEEAPATDAILAAKIPSLIYQAATKAIPGVTFALSFLPICSPFEFAAHLEDEIYRDVQEKYSDQEETWEALARRHLSKRQKKDSASEGDENVDGAKKSIVEARSVFECAVSILPTEKMWKLYIQFYLELLEKSHSQKKAEKRLLRVLDLMRRASEENQLTLGHHLEWVKLLQNCGEADEAVTCAEAAVAKWARSTEVWLLLLELQILRSAGADAVTATLERALKHIPKEESLPIWQLGVTWMSAACPTRIIEFLEQGLYFPPAVCIYVKEKLLELNCLYHGYKAARKFYRR
ncbi:unnamed protein product [Ixodes hexagonus]